MDTFSEPNLIHILPNTCLDDFFFFGFVAGVVGYAYYLFVEKNDAKNHLHWIIGLYGAILSGSLGGLLAIVFDRNIAISILVGLLNQLIYMGLVRSVKGGNFTKVLKEILVRYLTGGKTL